MFIFSSLKMRLFRSINSRLENYKRKTSEGIELLFNGVLKGGVLGLVIATIVWISIFLYIVFYYFYMPSLSHTRPVHLQFTACETVKGVCSFPSAHVQLTKKNQLLMVGQKYKIFLTLEMPESPANIDLGMFMVCARMVDADGILVSNSCRSTMLHYRSWLLKLFITLVNSPFLLFGSHEEKQNIVVELYSDFEEHQSHPVTDIYVEIQSRFVELYSATMHIQAHLSGLRYLMFHWPILSAICGVSTNLFMIAFITSLSWYHLYGQHEHGKTNILNLLKKSSVTKKLKRRILGEEGQIEERTPSAQGTQTESNSESDESKSEFFKPGTSEDLGSYLEEVGD